MGSDRIHAPELRRLLIALVVVATISAAASQEYGEQVTTWLDVVPASTKGWGVIGWLFGGPPLLLAAFAWNDRRRLSPEQRHARAGWYGGLFGLGGFVVPALTGSSLELFGDGLEIGNPLAFGWTCGAVANLAALAFAFAITRMSARAGRRGHDLELRFIETGWVLLMVGSLLFAAYGRELGFVY